MLRASNFFIFLISVFLRRLVFKVFSCLITPTVLHPLLGNQYSGKSALKTDFTNTFVIPFCVLLCLKRTTLVYPDLISLLTFFFFVSRTLLLLVTPIDFYFVPYYYSP
uniref:Uncharacterized protein n=1 Tax=Cacopsylla melanoneura TaxID=428564 RepID=A0A8D9E3B3_9HEMI